MHYYILVGGQHMKMTRAQWQVTTILVLGMGCLTAFQNCSSQVSFSDPAASQNGMAQDSANQANGNPNDASNSTNSTNGTNQTNSNPNSNTTTNTTTTSPNGVSGGNVPTDPTPPSQNCGNQIEINGHCVDFQCSSVINLTSAADLQNIPARTVEGLCYSYKMADAIANSASSLTTAVDADVVSRNHSGGSATRNPYLMASIKLDVKLGGGRVVKLAGGSNATSPILVDNFLLVGVYPSNTAITDWATYYNAYGTSDSTVANNSILFHNQNILLQPFGGGGTSTIAPLDISKFIFPLTSYTLDIRAEDCGGARQLSSLYLLFQ